MIKYRRIIIILIAIFLWISNIQGAGLLSDIYLNRAIDNYRYYTNSLLSPSMTTELDQALFGLNYLKASKIRVNYLNTYFYWPIGLRWTLGLSYYSPGTYTQYVINKAGERQGITFTVGEQLLGFNISYRRSFFSTGFNINWDNRKDVVYLNSDPSQGIQPVTNNIVGVDFGLTFYPLESYTTGDLEFGITAQNLIGRFFPLTQTEEVSYPNIVLNYRYRFPKRQLSIMGDFSLNSLGAPTTDSSSLDYGLSSEIYYELPAYLSFGTGYIKNFYGSNFVYFLTELKLQYIITRISRLYFEIGSSLEGLSDLDFTYKFGFNTTLYKTREEMWAEKLYNLLKIAPMNAYNEALKLYKQKKYLEAAFKFGYVMAKYPKFYKVDAVAWYLGSCYEKLNLNDIARQVWEKAIEQYSTSDYRAFYLFGLENLDYKEKNYDEALEKYNKIIKEYPNSDAVNGANYIAGNIFYTKGEYDKAIEVLSKVDTTSEYYLYAQYTIAVSFLAKGDLDNGAKHLTNIVTTPVGEEDKALKELQYKSYILLGHIYQEKKDLTNALKSYSVVPNNSAFFDEALVGVSWAFIKAHKSKEALKYINILISLETPYKPEGYLLLGYAYTFLEDYGKAIDAYEKAIELANEYLNKTPDEVKELEIKKQELLMKYQDVGEKSFRLAMSRLTTNRDQKVAELITEFKDVYDELLNLNKEIILKDKFIKFKPNYDRVIREAEFAKATVLQLQKEKQKQEIIKKAKDEEKKKEQQLKELEELEKGLE